MTLTEFFERYYHTEDMRASSLSVLRVHLRRWEHETGNIDLDEIDNAVVAEFRRRLIDAGMKPSSIQSYWASVRTVLRLAGPAVTGNPWGMGIISRVPAMRPVPSQTKLPRRIKLDDLDHAYVAARQMKHPRRGFKAAYWWQSLLVMLYTTGLRISDALAIQWEDVDLSGRTLHVVTSKTGIEAELPLTEFAVAHLQRINRGGKTVFGHINRRYFYILWKQLQEHAGVDFYPHDIRRTACSEADKVSRGMGKVLMLHAPSNVTERSYLNALPDLRDVVDQMATPIAFRHGLKMAARAFEASRRERLKMHSDKFALPEAPGADQWEFIAGGVAMAGRTIIVRGHKWTILRSLAKAAGPVTMADLWTACYGSSFDGTERSRKLVMKHVTYLRARLREWLGLSDDWDPIPVATSAQWADATRYTLSLPPLLQDRRSA